MGVELRRASYHIATMTDRCQILCIAAALLSTVACSFIPSSPSNESNQSFAWTVDGEPFRASSNGMGALRSDRISINGFDCGRPAGMTIQLLRTEIATGTYVAGADVVAQFYPNAASGNDPANISWDAGIPGRAGPGQSRCRASPDRESQGLFRLTWSPRKTTRQAEVGRCRARSTSPLATTKSASTDIPTLIGPQPDARPQRPQVVRTQLQTATALAFSTRRSLRLCDGERCSDDDRRPSSSGR
jgi:hypothetical protein